jgi:hypothetical protein
MQRTHYLRRSARIAGGLFSVFVATISLHGQTLPAMPPTALPGQTTPGAPETVTPPPNPPHHAEVLFADGQLQVRADNSSLNQILRSISHITGLKITGGVEEQRVFGNYGPAPMSTVLATLIDGTGANILLLGGDAKNPPELILTARSGGPEPPSPDSPAYAIYDDNNDHQAPVPPPHTESPPTQPQPPVISGSASVPPTPAAASPTPARTPGQPLTPEMVEQELLQMQAQQDLKKRQLDEKMQQQQIDQQKKLQNVKPQNPSSQPPASSNPQQ